jgi:hypothetical protein
LTQKGRTDFLLATTRQMAWASAQQQTALALIEASHAELADVIDPSGKRFVVEEIRTALRVGADEAPSLLVGARVLQEKLPATRQALQAGMISARQARLVVESN